jgi:chromosome segregation ATPase
LLEKQNGVLMVQVNRLEAEIASIEVECQRANDLVKKLTVDLDLSAKTHAEKMSEANSVSQQRLSQIAVMDSELQRMRDRSELDQKEKFDLLQINHKLRLERDAVNLQNAQLGMRVSKLEQDCKGSEQTNQRYNDYIDKLRREKEVLSIDQKRILDQHQMFEERLEAAEANRLTLEESCNNFLSQVQQLGSALNQADAKLREREWQASSLLKEVETLKAHKQEAQEELEQKDRTVSIIGYLFFFHILLILY